jgi:hypothetical protein
MELGVEALLKAAERTDAVEKRMCGAIASNAQGVDRTPWLQRTGWLRHFVQKDMVKLRKRGGVAR